MEVTPPTRWRPLVAIYLALLLFAPPAAAQGGPHHPVGRMNRLYYDGARQSWLGEATRPLDAVVWYPAAAGTPQQERTVDVFRFGSSQLDAPAATGGPWPLILVSHGVGGTAMQLSWLAEQLVRQGYVVAGVNHHGNTATEERVLVHGVVLPTERALDLSALLDQLLADPATAPLIDPTRVGAAGFSFGGYTVLVSAGMTLDYESWWEYCRNNLADAMCTVPPEADFSLADVDDLRKADPEFEAAVRRNRAGASDVRIRAVYAVAPALVTMADLTGLQVPAAVTLAQHDSQVPLAGTVGAFGAAPRVELNVVAAEHYTFLAPCTTLGRWFAGAVCRDPSGVNRERVHAEVRRQVVAFFGEHLGAE